MKRLFFNAVKFMQNTNDIKSSVNASLAQRISVSSTCGGGANI